MVPTLFRELLTAIHPSNNPQIIYPDTQYPERIDLLPENGIMSELDSPNRHDGSAPTYQTSILDEDEDQSHSTTHLLPKTQEYENETAPADAMKELEMDDVKNLSPSPSSSPRLGSTFGIDDEWTPSPRFKRPRPHSRSRTGSFRRSCLLFLLKAVLAVWFGVVLYNVVRYCARQSPKHPSGLPESSTSTSTSTITIDEDTPADTSRRIIIDSEAVNIHGVYPLYDFLSLTTTTGNITVAIAPQPAHPDHPFEPARLHIRSLSGTVTVSFTAPEAALLPGLELDMELNASDADNNNRLRTKTLPARPYDLDIQTETGPIAGRMVFSRSVRLVSGGGDITAMLIPITAILGLDENPTREMEMMGRNVSISTETESGKQHIHVTQPFILGSEAGAGPETFHCVKGSHVAGDGAMEVAYPAAWAGSVHVRTEGGSVRLEGKGVEVVESAEGMVDAMVRSERMSDDEVDDDQGSHGDEDENEVDNGDAEDDDDDDERGIEGWMDVTFKSKEGSILFYVG